MDKKKWGTLGCIIVLILGVAIVSMCLDGNDENKLIGEWKISEHNIKFNNNYTYEERIINPSPGGMDMIFYGEYSVDFSQELAWINVIPGKSNYPIPFYYHFGTYVTKPIAKGLIRFHTNDEIELAFTTKDSTDGGRVLMDQRPTSFESKNETVILTLTRLKK